LQLLPLGPQEPLVPLLVQPELLEPPREELLPL
jgi:hypothetical protein